ncbi:hypothetical protein [Treponema sp.]|uniref:hypothetical protein n=1 Tax=Treponema sp. TaxID=166 RepID=UPI00298DC6BA|nr:hypothetical protein [Treponema sp.]MCQ2241872.1 hypothetical protein [Treponema sp.]
MQALDNIKERIENFLQENTKLTVAVCVILVSFVVLAFIIGAFSEPAKPKAEKNIFPDSIPYSAVEEFFEPKKENLTEDYYFTREQTSQWSDGEFDRWFTVPDKSTVDELGKANEKVADEILGAAP